MSDDRLLDASEAAELLHVPVRWIREGARTGRLPCVRLGRYVRFRRSTLTAWVEEQEQPAKPGAPFRKHRPVIT